MDNNKIFEEQTGSSSENLIIYNEENLISDEEKHIDMYNFLKEHFPTFSSRDLLSDVVSFRESLVKLEATQTIKNKTLDSTNTIAQLSDHVIKLGTQAGLSEQQTRAIAIGFQAGFTRQGTESIAIGAFAGYSNQVSQSIILNATGTYLNANASGVFIAPIRNQTASVTNVLNYNPSTFEISFGSLNEQLVDLTSIQTFSNKTLDGSNSISQLNDSTVRIGFDAGFTGQNSLAIAIGRASGAFSQGSGAIAIGLHAGYSNQESMALSIGIGAGAYNQKSGTVAIGLCAGFSNQASMALSIGSGAGAYNQASAAIAIGLYAGNSEQSFSALAVGTGAGAFNQGSGSIAIGVNAGAFNQGKRKKNV